MLEMKHPDSFLHLFVSATLAVVDQRVFGAAVVLLQLQHIYGDVAVGRIWAFRSFRLKQMKCLGREVNLNRSGKA